MKVLVFALIASLFASEFQDMEEDEIKLGKIVKKILPKVLPKIPKVGPIIAPFLAEEDGEDEVKFNIKLEVHNEDMFAPEFDEIEDDLKFKIGKIFKKLLPKIIPKIPKIGPVIAPFLSEEDMEPEVIEYDQDELAELVLAELAEEYEIDAGFLKKIGSFIKKVAPTVIKTFVPKIPHVGPIIAPFLGEEDSVSFCPIYKRWNATLQKCVPRPCLIRRGPHKPIILSKPKKPVSAAELDEFKLGKIFKKLLPKIIPKIPKIGPVIAPFLGEEDSDEIEVSAEMEEYVIDLFAEQLMEEGYELDENFFKKIGSWLKPRIPQIIRTFVPLIPKVGPKIAPIIEPFLGEEDTRLPIMTHCPWGSSFDYRLRKCVPKVHKPRCPTGMKLNSITNLCEKKHH